MKVEIDTSSDQFQQAIRNHDDLEPEYLELLLPEAIDAYQRANPGTLEERIAEAVRSAVLDTIL